MVKIINVEPGSIAEELRIKPGDRVISVNGHAITDRLDYRFYINEEHVELLLQKGKDQIIFEIEKEPEDDLGITLEEMKLKSCGNNCVFCFVYQNPKGLRKPLYFKDEDYRYSFLYGHYVTMTTMKQRDLDRIVEQRLSPLYISVHATEEKTRKLLLGIKRNDHLLEKIEFLTSHGIELHAQIVLCPDINDGEIFDRTVNDLKAFYPGIKSIAVVPLGLTQHREGLMPLRLHTVSELKATIEHVDEIRKKLKKELGVHFVYLADEFYIKAQQELPPAEYYDEFYQIENGVGEFRDMIDRFEREDFPRLPKKFPAATHITWVTGMLALRPLERFIVNPLRTIKNLTIDLVPVTNHFYGPSIQVSGLLVGQDIYNQLKNRSLGQMVLLPPRLLNEDGLFLDDWTVNDLEEKLGVPCYVFTESFDELPHVTREVINRKAG